jgi:hypothetical protein
VKALITVWAAQLDAKGPASADPTGGTARTVDGSCFSVVPTANNVDHLKKAIKPAWNDDPAMQASITIYAPDPDGDVEVVLPGDVKAKYTTVTKQSTALVANTEDTPYLFELP